MKQISINKIWSKIAEKMPLTKKNRGFSNSTAPAIITKNLETNIELILNVFKNCSDLSCKHFNIGTEKNTYAAILYIDTLVDNKIIHSDILEPLMQNIRRENINTKESLIDYLKNSNIISGSVTNTNNTKQLITEALLGKIILFVNHCDEGLLIDCKLLQERSIIEPLMESVNRGPRDGFTESVKTNIALVRQRLKCPTLKIRKLVIGERTNTDVVMLYIDDIANKDAVDNVYSRLSLINIDGILESGYVEEFLETNPYSLFPQVDNTERPDKVVACLLEGRIAIIVDGTPMVSIVPSLFIQLFQSPEDYYQRTFYTAFVRITRYLASFLATSLPGIYLSLVSFHSQLIPSKLIELLLNGRSQLPFPATLEILLMTIMIDFTQEASSRLLGRVGQTVSIVATIVLGQAAVSANIAAPVTIVVIAATTIATYILASYPMEFTFRIIRYLIIIAASIFGIYGVVLVWLWIIIHLCGLKSINSPYLAPIAPFKGSDLKDTLIRLPLRKMFRRPLTLRPKDIKRQK